MSILFVLSLALFSAVTTSKAQETGQQQTCSFGQYTKDKPSPEDNLHSCKNYACSSCCTEELTKQLVIVPLQMVGGLNYSQCGGLSSICSQYMSYVQCFYQCSPNLYPWLGSKRRLNNLPMCGTFCNEWYNSCMSDKTCVVGQDWTRGFQVGLEGTTATYQCKAGATCRNFSSVYHTSREFCNTMWPGTIVYTEDGDANCMNPAGSAENNERAVKKAAGQDAPFTSCPSASYIDTGAIIGIVIGTLAGMAIIAGLIIFFVRNKAQKNEPKSGTPEAPTNEMEELNPEPAPLEEEFVEKMSGSG